MWCVFLCGYVHESGGACRGQTHLIRSPKAGVTSGCEKPNMDNGIQTWVLCKCVTRPLSYHSRPIF